MWAGGNLAFSEEIGAGLSIWRKMMHRGADGKGESVVASAIGEEAIVADAMEAVRQGVQEKALHELTGIKRHHLGFAADNPSREKLTLRSASEISLLLAMATRCVWRPR